MNIVLWWTACLCLRLNTLVRNSWKHNRAEHSLLFELMIFLLWVNTYWPSNQNILAASGQNYDLSPDPEAVLNTQNPQCFLFWFGFILPTRNVFVFPVTEFISAENSYNLLSLLRPTKQDRVTERCKSACTQKSWHPHNWNQTAQLERRRQKTNDKQ